MRCQGRDYAEGLSVSFIALGKVGCADLLVESLFGDVSEWGMSKIMCKSSGFNDIGVQSA